MAQQLRRRNDRQGPPQPGRSPAASTLQVLGVCAVMLIPIISAIRAASYTRFRDREDVYSVGMSAPLLLLLPLMAVVLTCLPLAAELSHRFLSLTRMRIGIGVRLRRRLASVLMGGFLTGFLTSAGAFVLAFSVWPLIGDPGVDPAGYGMTAAQATEESLRSGGFSDVLRLGGPAYGLVTSTWLGVCAALYAAMGFASLLLIPNRILALTTPMLIVFGQTFLASLAGRPLLALYYSAIPVGFPDYADALVVLPHVILGTVVATALVICIRRIPVTGRLT